MSQKRDYPDEEAIPLSTATLLKRQNAILSVSNTRTRNVTRHEQVISSPSQNVFFRVISHENMPLITYYLHKHSADNAV